MGTGATRRGGEVAGWVGFAARGSAPEVPARRSEPRWPRAC